MRQALGRGLDALFPATSQSMEGGKSGAHARVHRIPLEKIRPNHLQARRHFDPEKLSELAQSIKENGLAQPISVTFDAPTGTYELIAGERRLRACQLAGLTEVEAVVREAPTEKQRLTLNLIENLQREDLNPLEEALGYLRLMKEYSLTQAQLTDLIGKSKSAVSNTLRLLDLPEEVQKALQTGQITEGHARALLAVKNQFELNKLFHLVISRNMTVRDVEDYARRIQEGASMRDGARRKPRSAARKSPDILALEQGIQRSLGTKVDIKTGGDSQRGTITIHFYNPSDFEKIVGRLK